jgi:tRNA threonylcarbamoyladenosine biosynthesis protein TsaE
MSEQVGAVRFTRATLTRSAAATRTLGRRLGALLRPGDVVALEGDLGAGKTELVRGACAGARVPASEVSSPSFAIVATYRGRLPVHHADLYRIGDEDELYGTGFGDLVGGEGALLVEWADRIPGALPAERLTVRLAHHPRLPSARRIDVEGVGTRPAELGRALLAAAGRKRKAPARRARPAAKRASRKPGPRRPRAARAPKRVKRPARRSRR